MKTIFRFLFGRRRDRGTSWLGIYLANYNSAYFQQPGIRYFYRGQF
jgi:hypothetical protein